MLSVYGIVDINCSCFVASIRSAFQFSPVNYLQDYIDYEMQECPNMRLGAIILPYSQLPFTHALVTVPHTRRIV